MKIAKHIYHALLALYPHSYRKAFGAQMMQTFSDHYQDIEKSEGHVGLSFWLSLLTDEISNIMRQHMFPFKEGNGFLKATSAKLLASAVILVPFYAVFYVALVKTSLALPHVPVSGIGVVFTLAALVLLPGVLSLAVSYLLVSACVGVFQKAAFVRNEAP